MSINGNLYDWEGVEIVLPSGLSVGVTDVNYDDERPVEERYGKGSVARGYGRKNYKATANMTMDLDEALIFEAGLAAAGGGSIYGAPPFPIVVAYGGDGLPITTDVLPMCKVVKIGTGAKQGDENVGIRKYDLKVIEPIVWGGAPAMPLI